MIVFREQKAAVAAGNYAWPSQPGWGKPHLQCPNFLCRGAHYPCSNATPDRNLQEAGICTLTEEGTVVNALEGLDARLSPELYSILLRTEQLRASRCSPGKTGVCGKRHQGMYSVSRQAPSGSSSWAKRRLQHRRATVLAGSKGKF